MKPSVGRIVHLCWSGLRVPAVITAVNNDTSVNVWRLDGGGLETSVLLASEDEESTKLPNSMTTPHRTWAWPPRV